MIKDFHLIHRRKPHSLVLAGCPVWETCLRTIAVLPNAPQGSEGECFSHKEAYQFLLEIICGLHSPVVGETEVFGQFKNFTREWLKIEPQRARLVQRLFNEAKEIRTRHLSHMGSQSYGGWLKKNVTASKVHIIGAGHLAAEVLPHLMKSADQVTVHARSPSKVKFEGVSIRNLNEFAFDGGALVIAAPMASAEVRNWLKLPAAEIFDLRDKAVEDPIPNAGSRLVSLQDIFNEIVRTKSRLAPTVARVKQEILACSERVATQMQVRPQGWDDICA